MNTQRSPSPNPGHGPLNIENATFNDIAGHQINIADNQVNFAAKVAANVTKIRNYYSTATVFDLLKEHVAFSAIYNSAERESEHASVCQEGTRTEVLDRIYQWVEACRDQPICWLEGPAGSGKSTIAFTTAKKYADAKKLAFSFFFSRGNEDRCNTRKFVATCAYQLARSLPDIQPTLHEVLQDDASIPMQEIQIQIQKLLAEPTKDVTAAPMLAVVDGLDECENDVLLVRLIEHLAEAAFEGVKLCFLFTSRPETHLQTLFRSPLFSTKTSYLSLRDFKADADVRKYLQKELSAILVKRSDVMQDVTRPWPSTDDLETLVEKSEHLFIYVSTLVKFVGEKTGFPDRRLKSTLQSPHTGVDPMYRQIISLAKEYENYDLVFGTIMFLLQPLSVSGVAEMLKLQSREVRLALAGCYSILVVPETDDKGTLRPYHASLREFLTDEERSKPYNLPMLEHHAKILACCVEIISMTSKGEEGMFPKEYWCYACRNWMQHFLLFLINQGSVGMLEEICKFKTLEFLGNMHTLWFESWMRGMGAYGNFCNLIEQCSALNAGLPVCWLTQNWSNNKQYLQRNSPQLSKVTKHLQKINTTLRVCNHDSRVQC